jgi:hypothetical protein
LKKTKKLLAGVSTSALVLSSLAACGDNYADLPPVPEDSECGDWEWEDDEGVWECDDRNSPYFGYFFFGGKRFKTKSMLKSNKSYQNYRSSSSFKGGFGSGSKSYGG